MLFRALALFSVLSLVFLATESQNQNSRHNRNCLVIKNINGEYLTVNSRRQDRQRKLVLERFFQEKRSTFRFETQGQDRRTGRTIYRIESCDNNEAVSWALSDRLKLKDFNYYAFANDIKGVNEFDTWLLDFQSDGTFVQILDAESGGRFNLFSATATDDKGDRLALVYARDWPRSLSREENSKRFWTIDDAPNFKGSFERSFGRSNKPSPFGDKPSFGNFDNRPFDGKPSKPFGGFDDSPVLDAEKEVDDHNTDEKPLVEENDDEDEETTTTTTASTTTTEEPDHEDHEEEEEHKEEEEVLAAESKAKSKPKEPCYILKQRFRGLTYSMGLDTQGGQRRTNVIMEQGSTRSSENAWRLVPESDRTFSSKYKIQNCKTNEILSVSYKQSSKSDNRDGEVFVVDENDAQVWNVDERKDNKILISDASKPSFYLSVTSSNSKNSRIRDVVSTRRDDTDSDSIVFTFEEF